LTIIRITALWYVMPHDLVHS